MSSFDFKDYLYDHFKNNTARYYIILVSTFLGLVLGIVLALNGFSYTSILNLSDRNLINYINGSVGFWDVFISRFSNLFLCLIIIFVFNIVKQTRILNYIFLGYQMCLTILFSSAIITLYGLSGILNVLIFILPINIINIFLLSYVSCICMQRAYDVAKYKMEFGEGFKEKKYWIELFIGIVILIIFCIIHSMIYPLIFKSFIIVSY